MLRLEISLFTYANFSRNGMLKLNSQLMPKWDAKIGFSVLEMGSENVACFHSQETDSKTQIST